MSTARLQLFSEVLTALREARRLSVAELSEITKIPTATLYAYEARRRGVPNDKATILKQALCLDDADKDRFEESYVANGQLRGQSAMQERFGSDTATLYVADLNYSPFSGLADSFGNRFLEGILKPSVIKLERPAVMEAGGANGHSFSMKERMRWIEDGDADIIVNLQHPMRMRKLNFLLTPIRVSLNGVILYEDVADIREARKFLVSEDGEAETTFSLLAVENEVGHIYLRHSRQIPAGNIEVTDTFSAELLANQLQNGARKMLVCDEMTALAVVAAKGGEAVLVFPPSTDQSVVHFDARRQLPFHFLGFGIHRQNQELIDFFDEAVQNCLSTEVERVAKLVESSYDEIVKQVRNSFENNQFLYSGGLRRVPKYPEVANRNPVESSLRADVEKALITQNARAFARRMLNISKRSVVEVPDELWAWRYVLNRARERVLIAEARNRANVREIVIYAMKLVLGLDPTRNFGQSYQSYFNLARDASHWSDFRESLERELDVTFPQTLDPMHAQKGLAFWTPLSQSPIPGTQTGGPFGHLEWFVSAVQRAMEANTESSRLVSVKLLSGSWSRKKDDLKTDDPQESWAKTFVDLWEEYSTEIVKNPRNPLPKRESIVLVAFSLGQAVGFLKATQTEFRGAPATKVDDLYVTDSMQDSGISRRLIRALIDVSVDDQDSDDNVQPERKYVLVSTGSRPVVKTAFDKSGFRMSKEERVYFYRLYGLKDSDPKGL